MKEYKGFTIVEVYKYTNGRSDFEIFQDENGMIRPNTTLEQIKNDIDQMDELE